MSYRCFALLYVNMTGEMIYILEQRLKHVAMDRSPQVLKEIVSHIFKKKHLDDVFKPQDLPSRAALRNLFEKLAHSSIMRLNDTSMDKLYDLMTMTSKYHVQNVVYAQQILTVACNHLAGIREVVAGDEDCLKQLDGVHAKLMSLYRPVADWEWLLIKQQLLLFFQDCSVKVSLMIRENRQLEDGSFIIFPEDEPIFLANGHEPPGKTKYFEDGKVSKTIDWPIYKQYDTLRIVDNYNLDGEEKSTLLGTNMYKLGVASMQIKGGGGTSKLEAIPAGDEMKLLETLFGGTKKKKGKASDDQLDLSMFEDEGEETTYVTETSKVVGNVTKIDANKKKKSLNSAIEEMNLDKTEKPAKKKGKGAGLLDLMDEAAARPATAKKTTRSRPVSRDAKSPAAPREKSAGRAGRAPSANSRPASRDRTGTAQGRPPTRTPSATRKKTT